MTDFVQTTLFGPKDSLPSGDPEKIILGADFDVEFANLVTSIASKADDADLAATDANVAANTLDIASNLTSIAATNTDVAANAAAIAANATAIATNTSDIAAVVSPVQQVSRNSSLLVGSSAAFVDDPQLSGVLVLEPSSRHSFEAFLILDARFGPTGTQLEIMLTTSTGAALNGQAIVTVGGLPTAGASGPEATVFADADLTLPVEVNVSGGPEMSIVHIVGSFNSIGGSPAFLDIGYRTVGSTQSTAFRESWLKVTRDTI